MIPQAPLPDHCRLLGAGPGQATANAVTPESFGIRGGTCFGSLPSQCAPRTGDSRWIELLLLARTVLLGQTSAIAQRTPGRRNSVTEGLSRSRPDPFR